MEFCLFYRGKLPSNGDIKEKHRIRLALQPQIEKLWEQKPLSGLLSKKMKNGKENDLVTDIGGIRFQSIVTGNLNMIADLEIDFLRYGNPGELVQCGDIDNRVKTLFDALRSPNNSSEIPTGPEFDSENKKIIFCLLDDDRLIANLKINTFQNLNGDDENDVILLIKVKTRLTSLIYDNMGL
ncbi:MAG: hypothetical protein JW881_05405 [Spirochaetales bacterium]|nr:hypothetical protein [Spirochaetales bacterium]